MIISVFFGSSTIRKLAGNTRMVAILTFDSFYSVYIFRAWQLETRDVYTSFVKRQIESIPSCNLVVIKEEILALVRTHKRCR